jgi:hypothetical protein
MKFAATNSATDRPICWPRELIQAVVNAAVDSALRLLLGGFPEPGELVRHVRLPAGLMPRRLSAARRYHHDSLAKYREIDDRWASRGC